MYIIIALCVVLSVLVLTNLIATIKKLKEVKRLNQLNVAIYKEYKEVGGGDWADKLMKDMIKRVVKKVDGPTTNGIHCESRRIQCQTA